MRTSRLGVAGLVTLILSCSRGPDFVSVDYTVMGTSARVVVPAAQRRLADSAYVQMLVVDSLMSTWNARTELSRLNADGHGVVSPLTARCISVGLETSALTGGAFDPTVWPLVHAWGFDSHDPHQPDPDSLALARTLVNWHQVRLAGDTVWLGQGQRLDLGGVAKGLALDLAAEKLRSLECQDFLVDIGGDIICGGTKGGKPWAIGIRDPMNRGGMLGVIELEDVCVCTSGDYERFVEIDGTRYSHIMDPREGEPSRGVVSVTVIGQGGARVDALATGLFVLGPEAGLRLADSLGIEAMFVYHDADSFATTKTLGFPEVKR